MEKIKGKFEVITPHIKFRFPRDAEKREVVAHKGDIIDVDKGLFKIASNDKEKTTHLSESVIRGLIQAGALKGEKLSKVETEAKQKSNNDYKKSLQNSLNKANEELGNMLGEAPLNIR